MKGTWWKTLGELDPEQKKFVGLPMDGNYKLSGPPGCGKTNLLLLRAKFAAKKNLHNILFLTYASCLADYIRSGVGTHFDPSLVMTYWKWARQHIQDYYPAGLEEYEALFKIKNDEAQKRARLIALLQKAYDGAPTHNLYEAIFLDEAQDLSAGEIAELSKLTTRLTIAGDNRQGVYKQDGMTADGFEDVPLKYHYRIGRRICTVADKLLPPMEGEPTLYDRCRYREDLNASDAEAVPYASAEDQYDALIERLHKQQRAFNGELLGIFFPKKKLLADFREYIAGMDIANEIAFHDLNDAAHTYASNKQIHAMTIHSAKGSEFTAAHIVRGEEIKFPLHHLEIIFTAVTRARTSVTLYYTEKLLAPIRSAFATPTEAKMEDLFDEA